MVSKIGNIDQVQLAQLLTHEAELRGCAELFLTRCHVHPPQPAYSMNGRLYQWKNAILSRNLSIKTNEMINSVILTVESTREILGSVVGALIAVGIFSIILSVRNKKNKKNGGE